MSTIQRDYELTYIIDVSQAVPALGNLRRELVRAEQDAGGMRHNVDQLSMSLHALASAANGVTIPALNATTSATKSLGQSVLGLAGTWFVLEKGVEVLGMFGEKANVARQTMHELADEVRKTRDDFRELANLKNHDSPDDEIVAETIKQGAKTGMMPAEARQFMEQFVGSGETGKNKGNISDATEKGLAVEAMKFGVRNKLAPSTAGDLAGVLSQYEKIGSVKEGAGQLGQIAMGLNDGRGNLEPLVKSLIKTAGAVVSEDDGAMVWNMPELAAIMGVAATHASPDAAGTKVRKAVRGLRQFKGKQGATLKNLGIDAKQSYLKALSLIAPKIKEADAAGVGGDSWLRSNGFDDEAEITAIMEQARDYDVIMQRKKKQEGITGDVVMERDENYLSRTVAGQSRRVKAQKAAQDYTRGAEQERLDIARESAGIEMKDTGEVGGFWNFAQEMWGDALGIKPLLGFRKTKDRWLDEKSFRNAHKTMYDKMITDGMSPEAAKENMAKLFPSFSMEKLNADGSKPTTAYGRAMQGGEGDGLNEYGLSDRERAQAFNKLAVESERRQVNPFGDNDARINGGLNQLINEAKKTNEILKNHPRAIIEGIQRNMTAGPGLVNPVAGSLQAGLQSVAPVR